MIGPASHVDGDRAASYQSGCTYLKLPFNWKPVRRALTGPVEYELTLHDGRTATLTEVAGKGLAMRISTKLGPDTPRGLFGTPHDALMVLVAESGAGR